MSCEHKNYLGPMFVLGRPVSRRAQINSDGRRQLVERGGRPAFGSMYMRRSIIALQETITLVLGAAWTVARVATDGGTPPAPRGAQQRPSQDPPRSSVLWASQMPETRRTPSGRVPASRLGGRFAPIPAKDARQIGDRTAGNDHLVLGAPPERSLFCPPKAACRPPSCGSAAAVIRDRRVGALLWGSGRCLERDERLPGAGQVSRLRAGRARPTPPGRAADQ